MNTNNQTSPGVPSLSELIEECGEEFTGLQRVEDTREWYAVSKIKGDNYVEYVQGEYCETAVDAIIDLLNKTKEAKQKHDEQTSNS